jgi:hypothetical protein
LIATLATMLTLPALAQVPSTTRVDAATPATYTAAPGATVAITLNWYRVRMAADYLQFMHLVSASGAQWSVDDNWTTSASWTAGPISQVRTITVPAGLPNGTYDIRVGLSGGNPWTDQTLVMGAGVTDPGNDRRYKVGTLTVSPTTVTNVAPQITSTPLTTATVGAAYAYRVAASDANGDTLTYSLTQAPSGMTIGASTGQIAWTPTSAQVGSQAVTARVVDPGGLAATQSFTVTVAAAVTNVAPQITSAPITTARVGTPYGYQVTATDANGGTLAYSLTRAPSGMTINSATGQIAWTPTAAQIGNRGVTARVTDPGGLFASQAFTVVVTSANAAPSITSAPVTTATVGAPYAYRVTATDPNGDVLTYALSQAPAGMTINATSGQIAWTPASTQTGTQAVTARVTDPGGLAAVQSFTVSVTGGNVAPQITSAPVTAATVGSAYGYKVTATDANGDVLAYSLTQAPAGMTIGTTTGQIAWTPTSSQTGAQAVTVRVADPGGLAATQAFSVNVTNATLSPQIGNSWRIMPVGDSNTENLAALPGYQVITQALTAAGRNSQVFGYVNPNEPVIVKPVTQAQIGRSGWSTTDVLGQIDGWVDQVIPDIVLLNIGVNDGYFPNDPAGEDAVVSRIAAIIDRIHARNPRTAVLVSNFGRGTDPLTSMATKIQQMALAKAAPPGSVLRNVFFVPSLTGVTGSMYVADGVHPNESARLVIMDNWMKAVRSYVQTGTVAPLTPATVPQTTRVDMASPATVYALPGAPVAINLNWYRMPMPANLLQFMHLTRSGSTTLSVDDHWTTSATWTAGPFTQTRTITAPTAVGTYDIRVGLSGGSPWVDYVLNSGPGVMDETNGRAYKVGTLVVTTTPPP